MEKVRSSRSSSSWILGAFAGVIFAVLALALVGCGSGASTPSHPSGGTLSIALTQAPPSSLATSGTATISATVTNDTANAGVDWSCAPVGSCGTFSPAHTASGATTTYTAPATAPTGGTVTITAASTTSHSATAVATVSITGSSNTISIALTTAPPATLVISGTATVSATVTNDTANAGVDWSCAPVGSCGTFNPAHTASGATTTYTAPAAVPAAPGTVTITAASTTSPTVTATATITVGAVNAAALSAGTYSFYVTGEDSRRNTYAIAGAFILAANGTITGEQDYVSFGGATSPEPTGDAILSGTLTIPASGLGTLTLVTSNGAVGVGGTETFSIAEVNSKHALIGEFDAGATSSGSIDLQTLASPNSLAELNGPFAFTVSGKNGSKAEAFGGLFTANAAGGLNVTELDSNEGGTISRGGTNSTATYTAPDAAGRGTMTFGGNHFVYYVVNAKVLRIVVTDAGEPDFGSAYTALTGVTNASVANSYLFTDSSILSAGATFAAAGKLTLDANGNITSGYADVDENGTVTSAAITTGTYSVNASGYGTITIAPGPTQSVSVLGLYLTDPTINYSDPNNAAGTVNAGLSGLLLDLDTNLTGSGMLILPGAAPYTFAGHYAFATQTDNTGAESDAIGTVNVAGTAVTGTQSLNDLFNTGQGNAIALSGTLVPDSVNTGRYTISLLVSLGSTPPTLKYVLYQASSSQFIVLEVDTPQFALGTLQQQQ